ncbi:MAG TPA: hypothetical protein VJN44_04000 [Roseateles sp.]|nr:hypothetical protein [Roseateles sp.]
MLDATSNRPSPDTFDFELVDLNDARGSLDTLPPGIEQMAHVRAGGWEGRRRKPLPTDRALTGQAIDWLLALPPDLRPTELSDRYPRLVNRIAENWSDLLESMALLNDLLCDRRGQRMGFAAPIQEELLRLRQHLQTRSR